MAVLIAATLARRVGDGLQAAALLQAAARTADRQSGKRKLSMAAEDGVRIGTSSSVQASQTGDAAPSIRLSGATRAC